MDDVDKYVKFVHSDELLRDFIYNDMEKRGVNSVNDWKKSITGTFS